MKTPFDAALRLRQREIDEVRVAIGIEVGRMLALEQRCDSIDASIRAERAIAGANSGFSSDAFTARMRAERAAVCRDHAACSDHLAKLRMHAIEAYGSFGAISAAVDRHREEALRVANIAEQNQIDDFSAARFTRATTAARRLRTIQAIDA
jgi:hypothetical protein